MPGHRPVVHGARVAGNTTLGIICMADTRRVNQHLNDTRETLVVDELI
jgi:hypothetical protein